MDEDRLVSAVSLPMWFPPVKINGDNYIDAVYVTDANVEHAVMVEKADEIWAIWTVSTRDEWRPGFVAQYFHIIEAAADTNFFSWWNRIKKNNDEIAAGRTGRVRPHDQAASDSGRSTGSLLVQFRSRDRMAEAVDLGVETARKWCRDNGIPLGAPVTGPPPTQPSPTTTSLQFTEDMRGFLGAGATDYRTGEDLGKQQGNTMHAHLTIRTEDVDRFVTDSNHQAVATGWIESPLLGGTCAGRAGRVQPARAGRRSAQEGDALSHLLEARRRDAVHVRRPQEDRGRQEPAGALGRHDDPVHDALSRPPSRRAPRRPRAQIATGIIKIHFFDFCGSSRRSGWRGQTRSAGSRASARCGSGSSSTSMADFLD